MSPTEMPFPDVKFCLFFPYEQQRAKNLTERLGLPWEDKPFFAAEDISNFFGALLSVFPDEQQARDAFQDIAFRIDEVLQSCTFADFECGPENFTTVYSVPRGNCFIFSTNQSQLRPGKSFGASFSFWIGAKDAIITDYLTQETGQGINIVIGDKKDSLPITRTVLAAPQTQTFFQLLRTDYEDATNSGNCYQVPDGTRYSSQQCFSDCLDLEIESMCQCTGLTCYLATQHDCFTSEQSLRNATDICLDKSSCPEPCKSTKYHVQTSASVWPNDAILEQYINLLIALNHCPSTGNLTVDVGFCRSQLDTSLLRVQVAFAEFSYTTYTQTIDFGIDSLMSQIGGFTGLYIGSSFLSMVEIAEVVFLFLLVTTLKTKKIARNSLKQMNSFSRNSA
eukprot:c11067_g1_i2.p1 GENE.c11067_g1_i2~~c11067_g1_i2.p1  ORF type:complete len:393 (+),score=103.72 c11067_g1_i2:494-1672(+)